MCVRQRLMDGEADGESAWLPPCVVSVINDNLYGLMFVLSYTLGVSISIA